MKKIIITVLIAAVITSMATRFYMIQTAKPDRACTITWSGEAHEYR